MEDSFFAFSRLSEAWMMFAVMESDRSPLMVPGSAVCGFVAPMTLRRVSTAFDPSSIMSRTGPDVTWSTSSWKKGLVLWTPYSVSASFLVILCNRICLNVKPFCSSRERTLPATRDWRASGLRKAKVLLVCWLSGLSLSYRSKLSTLASGSLV